MSAQQLEDPVHPACGRPESEHYRTIVGDCYYDCPARRDLVEWCWRCQQVFTIGDWETCPRAPDGGPHERLEEAPGEGVRRGFSLHERCCPRHNASVLLPGDVSCRCRRLTPAEGSAA
jgi:hypothetical protein